MQLEKVMIFLERHTLHYNICTTITIIITIIIRATITNTTLLHLDEDTFLRSEEYAWESTSIHPTTRPPGYHKDVQPGGNAVGIL